MPRILHACCQASVLILALAASSAQARSITLIVDSPSFLSDSYIFEVDEQRITDDKVTFTSQGPSFDPDCAMYGVIDANNRIDTQVTLEITGMPLDHDQTMLVVHVSAVKAGTTDAAPVPGKDGKFRKTAQCPSVKRLSFTTRATIAAGEKIELGGLIEQVEQTETERFLITATAAEEQ